MHRSKERKNHFREEFLFRSRMNIERRPSDQNSNHIGTKGGEDVRPLSKGTKRWKEGKRSFLFQEGLLDPRNSRSIELRARSFPRTGTSFLLPLVDHAVRFPRISSGFDRISSFRSDPRSISVRSRRRILFPLPYEEVSIRARVTREGLVSSRSTKIRARGQAFARTRSREDPVARGRKGRST